ncbi:MAG TPA: thiamine pyrophosphate-dependent enzyme, partial [Stellaceae bacterium]|nr:thiamine pyrophosphate-dependent enzyme [Stellaceae bacterium]
NTPGPRFIESWHENLAVNMATGYTLMTGKPQAVMVHAGVGLLHGAMGILSALQADVPMLVMSGESVSLGEDPDLAIEPQWYGGLSVGGPERLVGPLVKHARAVASPFTLHESVVRAMELAARPPLAPVYLNVPLEHMLHGWTPPAQPRPVPPAPKVQAQPDEIATVAALIRQAKNPVIVTEASGRDPAAFAALVELAEALAIPAIGGNNMAFANFPTDHPLWLGIGEYGALADADLVLLVGGRAPWYPPHRRPTAGTIVSIHDTPLKTHMVYQTLHADHYLEGDIATALRLLTAAVRPGAADAAAIAARRQRWTQAHEAYLAQRRAAEEQARAGTGIDPVALCAALARALPAEAIIVDETITAHPIVRQHLDFTRPQSYFRVFGGLGQGLGVALGAKLAAAARPVVLVTGDGGFLYNPVIQALGAAKAHGLPILAVVFNNGRYQAMKQGHVHHYPAGVSVGADLFYGVHIDGPDYAEFAKPFGFWGRKVERLEALAAALPEALTALKDGKSAILNVAITR